MRVLVPAEKDREEGEVAELSAAVDPLAEYDAILASQVDRSDQLGPALPENILGPFARIVAPSFALPIVRVKRDLFPRPANADNLRVPRLNDMIEAPGFASPEGKRVDKALTQVQQNMTAAMAAVAKGATVAVEFKAWAAQHVDPDVRYKAGVFVEQYTTLMDANILLTRSMSDVTEVRREVLRSSIVNKVYQPLLTDKNPATPEWLGGKDMEGAAKRLEEQNRLDVKLKHDGRAKTGRYDPLRRFGYPETPQRGRGAVRSYTPSYSAGRGQASARGQRFVKPSARGFQKSGST
jgi:hypothetical protein